MTAGLVPAGEDSERLTVERLAILGPLAAGYAGRDGYRPEWGRV